MREIVEGDHRIRVEGDAIYFEGSMRLSGTEAYAPVQALMADVLAGQSVGIVLDLTGLEFLNSSGINLLAKFTIDVRNRGGVAIEVRGSKRIPWQSKSLPNLRRLYPALELVIV